MSELSEWVERQEITVTAGDGVVDQERNEDGSVWHHTRYRLTVRRPGVKPLVNVNWRQGLGVTTHPSETPADVMHALIMDASSGRMTFEEFVGEYGYSLDSRKAHRTWEACKRMAGRLEEFLPFGTDLDDLAELEH